MIGYTRIQPLRRAACVAVLLSSALCAQNLAGPLQGFVFDAPSGSVRQLSGTPGASTLGPALFQGLEFASIAPTGTHAVVCAGGQCSLAHQLSSGSEGASLELWGVPEDAAWSKDGGTLVLFSRSGQWLQTIRGVPGTPDIQAPADVASLGGTLTAVAVSADGNHIVLAIRGSHGGVFEWTAAGAFVPVVAGADPVGVVFSAAGATLHALDGASRSISEVNLAEHGSADTWPVAASDPVALQVGRDAQGRAALFVAGRDDNALYVYESSGHRLAETLPLSFAPTRVEAVGPGVYLLTRRSTEGELLWSYAPGRGAFFVPVPVDEQQGVGDSDATPARRVRR